MNQLLIANHVPGARDAIVANVYHGQLGEIPSPETLVAARNFPEISPSLWIRLE